MSENYDVVVVGLGVMGLCVAHRAATQGLRVLGLEQFSPIHDLGSSHGATRIIRKAYFEHPDYVPLLNTAYRNWRQLEAACRTQMYERTGLLIFGKRGAGSILTGVRRSADEYGVPVQFMSAEAAIELYPQFELLDAADWEAALEADAGYLHVESTLRAIWANAIQLGAVLQGNTAVQRVEMMANGARIHVQGRTISASKVIVSAGPWSGHLLQNMGINWPLAVHRTTLFWFGCQPWQGQQNGMPCFGFDLPEGFLYGFPALDERGLKAALHRPLALVPQPEAVNRQISETDWRDVAPMLHEKIPGVQSTPREGKVCLYTMTPDEHFLVDFHPEYRHCIVACGFSGHGFKFGSAFGEICLDMAMTGEYAPSARFLSAERFTKRN